MTHDGSEADVVIVGGGPIGLACALLLARRDLACCVVEARPLEQARADARLLALSAGTWQTLQPLLGESPLRRASIREVLVSSSGEFGSAHLSSHDFNGAELGATVLYGELLAALDGAVARESRIALRRPLRVSALAQMPTAVEVAFEDGSTLQAPLVIQAEGAVFTGHAAAGGDPAARTLSPIGDAWAVLANVQVVRPRGALAGAAYERFTREGPLALLPTPAGRGGDGEAFALVWCCDEAAAARRCALDPAAFTQELGAALGLRIGRVVGVDDRRRFALQQRVRDRVIAHRVVALGNAAQTLHPVAGQGFNLGLRDCVTLAQLLAGGRDPLAALSEYTAQRRIDRMVIATLTDWLPSLFATRFAPLAAARSLALAALDVTPMARRELAHVLMFGVRA